MPDTTDPQSAEPELTETQKAYNVAQYEIFQLAAYGHCTYTNGELLTAEGKRQQADYNDRIRKAREELEAAVLRLVAEHAETFRGGWGVPAAWLRSLADEPAELSLLAVRPDERETDTEPAAPVAAPPTGQAGLRERLITALDNASRTHPCPTLGDQIWSGCVHYDEAGRILGVGSCHSGRRADAVMAVLRGLTLRELELLHRPNTTPSRPDPYRATDEPHRLALSTALGLGTGAPWDAIRERAAELAGQGVAGGRVDVLEEAATALEAQSCTCGCRRGAEFLRQRAAVIRAAGPGRLAEDATPVAPSAATPNGTGGGVAASGVREVALREAIARIESPERRALGLGWESAREVLRRMLGEGNPSRLAAETPGPETQGDEVALLRLTVDAVEEGRRELRSENARLRAQLWTLAAALDGLHTLIATSSRDWGTYRVDAWLWAVLVGWDCEEQHEHDELCEDGAAMAEMQRMHGWNDEAVAKARRYRAAVHVLTAPAVVARPGKEA